MIFSYMCLEADNDVDLMSTQETHTLLYHGTTSSYVAKELQFDLPLKSEDSPGQPEPLSQPRA